MGEQTEESRPGRGRQSENTGGRSASHGTGSAAIESALTRGDMALLVVSGLRGGGVRRKVVFTIAAAMRALDLAAARGVPASVALVRLAPVERVDLEVEGGSHD